MNLVSKKVVLEMLGIKQVAMRNLIAKEGFCKPVKAAAKGHFAMFDKEEVEQWIRSHAEVVEEYRNRSKIAEERIERVKRRRETGFVCTTPVELGYVCAECRYIAEKFCRRCRLPIERNDLSACGCFYFSKGYNNDIYKGRVCDSDKKNRRE